MITVKNNEVLLRYKLKPNESYRVDKRLNIFSLHIFKKPQTVSGVTSMTEDRKHIIFLDYDNICKWIVEAELEELSKEHAPFYLFKTKEKKVNGQAVGNYHAICLEKLSPNEIVKIQRTTHCDKAYITMPLRNRFRSWVLRQSKLE